VPRFKLERLLNQGKATDLSPGAGVKSSQLSDLGLLPPRPSRQENLALRHHRRAASLAGSGARTLSQFP
jgi:hypothetical protein